MGKQQTRAHLRRRVPVSMVGDSGCRRAGPVAGGPAPVSCTPSSLKPATSLMVPPPTQREREGGVSDAAYSTSGLPHFAQEVVARSSGLRIRGS